MNDGGLDPELRGFILKYLDSIAHLETLLLFRASPLANWDVTTTAKRLYASESQTSPVLERLTADGLIRRTESGFTYGQHDEELTHLIDQLATAYSTHLIPITNLIHDKSGRIQEFADAFKIKKGR